MPEGAWHECRYPHCSGYAIDANGYCDTHSDYDRRALDSPFVHRWTHSARYIRARRSWLVRHPVCAVCKAEAATDLDHVQPHRGSYALFWDQANWQGLCHVCHSRKTARGG
jgi:5-methylcytosine-specific restriction protein A